MADIIKWIIDFENLELLVMGVLMLLVVELITKKRIKKTPII